MSAGVGVPPVSSSLAALHEALDFLTLVFERTGQRCRVVLDEFQDLFTVSDGLDGVLRSHLQHQGQSAFYVFAGSQPSMMRALFGDRRRPLFEQARALALGPLPAAELADHMEDRLTGAGRDGLLELVDALVAVSAGHPQRAMLLAHMLFKQADDDPDALPWHFVGPFLALWLTQPHADATRASVGAGSKRSVSVLPVLDAQDNHFARFLPDAVQDPVGAAAC